MAIGTGTTAGGNSRIRIGSHNKLLSMRKIDGIDYPCNYFADDGYCPTPYVFDVAAGQFWQPGNGYINFLPASYHAPITVAIQESVPTYSADGQIAGYQLQNFYYNAFWDAEAQSYAYYDYRQQFHWLTFPWLNSWEQ
jgi:hypothetical protein